VTTPERPPSLRRRLLFNMLLPATLLAVVLGIGGSFLIHGVVQTAHDRVLDASVLAIAERVETDEDNRVTVDLPRVALGMLGTRAQDSIYYSITYDGVLVTGYNDLPLPDAAANLSPGRPVHFNAAYRDARIRVAALAQRVYGKPDLALVEVAETLNARRSLEYELLAALTLLEVGLLAVVGFLAWRGIGRGLQPLAALSRQIEARHGQGGSGLTPLDQSGVPEEVLAPVAAFNTLLERLRQSMESVRRFTGDASHQMRTPLAVLRMRLDQVRRDGLGTAEGRAALDDVDAAARRLERLLVQLLALARADDQAGPEPAPDQESDLAAAAVAVVTDRVPQAIAAGVEVQFDGPDHPLPVWGHTMLIEELIGNLMDNAIRHNRRGGTVIVRVRAEAGGVRLDVQDDGPGIPAAERARVFERFYRVARRAGPEGTGLGLAIVRALADRLGASVALTDAPNGPGLVATVRFRAASRSGRDGERARVKRGPEGLTI